MQNAAGKCHFVLEILNKEMKDDMNKSEKTDKM